MRFWLLPAATFLNTFAWGFAQVSLPFYVTELLAGDRTASLLWIGWIMGVTPVGAITTAPIWVKLTARWDPRRSFTIANALQGIACAAVAVLRSPLEIFLSRAALGLAGPSNTYAFLIAGRAGGNVTWQVSVMQSALTLGILMAPLAGALVAAHFGYAVAFVVSGACLWMSGAAVALGAPKPSGEGGRKKATGEQSWRALVFVCALVLVAYSQVLFLNSVMPHLLPALGVSSQRSLEFGGWLLFASGVAISLGALAAPFLTARLGERRMIELCLVGSSLTLIALPSTLWGFVAVWLLHVACVAPILPAITARLAQNNEGQAIAFVQSSRVAANFLGPVIATTLLSVTSATGVFVALAALGLASTPLARRLR